jgi:cytidylate kinase
MSGMRRHGLVIAIDGPSGAGKSTLTRLLADRLGYVHIDTGAMYRTLALAVSRAEVSPDDEAAVAAVCRKVEIGFCRDDGCCRVTANGEDVTEAIRTPEISMLTSRISAQHAVRDILLGLQRELGRDGGVILEGRDIGTVVFPDAEVKYFLSASAEERGRRRFQELRDKGCSSTLEETIAAVAKRDEQDADREIAPLRKAADAVEIDSTGVPVEVVLQRMEQVCRERLASCPDRPQKGMV